MDLWTTNSPERLPNVVSRVMGHPESTEAEGGEPGMSRLSKEAWGRPHWGAILTAGCVLTILVFTVAATIRLDKGLGRVLGVDWNAFGDALWAVLAGLSELGPLGTAAAAAVAAIALSQKWKADDRSAWWSRVQWAADHSLSKDDEAQLIGMSAMASIRADGSPSEMDRKLMNAIGQRAKKEEMDDAVLEHNNEEDPPFTGNASEGGNDGAFRKAEEEDPGQD